MAEQGCERDKMYTCGYCFEDSVGPYHEACAVLMVEKLQKERDDMYAAVVKTSLKCERLAAELEGLYEDMVGEDI